MANLKSRSYFCVLLCLSLLFVTTRQQPPDLNATEVPIVQSLLDAWPNLVAEWGSNATTVCTWDVFKCNTTGFVESMCVLLLPRRRAAWSLNLIFTRALFSIGFFWICPPANRPTFSSSYDLPWLLLTSLLLLSPPLFQQHFGHQPQRLPSSWHFFTRRTQHSVRSSPLGSLLYCFLPFAHGISLVSLLSPEAHIRHPQKICPWRLATCSPPNYLLSLTNPPSHHLNLPLLYQNSAF